LENKIMNTNMEWEDFENKIGVSFKNQDLLKQAFVHRSYLNENRGFKLGHNERLEFLGDAVLELAITKYLFEKYPEKPEGELTSLRSALVNTNTLSEIGLGLGLNDFLLLSRGEAKDTGRARQYILANTMEALIGAIYLDQGYESAESFISKNVSPVLEKVIAESLWIDSKSRFQEIAQDETGITPTYKTEKESGPDHDKHFTVGVYLKNELVATGEGKSKQDAEQSAARKALEEKGWE